MPRSTRNSAQKGTVHLMRDNPDLYARVIYKKSTNRMPAWRLLHGRYHKMNLHMAELCYPALELCMADDTFIKATSEIMDELEVYYARMAQRK